MWVFEQVDEAIILEDDTLPDPSFFPFCEELLEKYRHDERVMHISGDNWLVGQKEMAESYSFSRYSLSWGWACWRRAFRLYDPEIKLWPLVRETRWLEDVIGDDRAVEYWKEIFDLAHAGIEKIETWDYQWLFTIWIHHGLSILPGRNLISNLGFNRPDATHLRGGAGDPRNEASAAAIGFPIKHPSHMVRDREGDQLIFDRFVHPLPQRSLYSTVRNRCVTSLPPTIRRSLALLKSRFGSMKHLDGRPA
jgi:hypothetical protein